MNKTEGWAKDEFERPSQQPCPHPNYTAKVTCSCGQNWDLNLSLATSPRWNPGPLAQAPWVSGYLSAEWSWCIFPYPHCTVDEGPESTLWTLWDEGNHRSAFQARYNESQFLVHEVLLWKEHTQVNWLDLCGPGRVTHLPVSSAVECIYIYLQGRMYVYHKHSIIRSLSSLWLLNTNIVGSWDLAKNI